MTDLHKAAQQALDRLRLYYYGSGFADDAVIITALEAALAQQAEPKGGGRLPPPLQAEPVQEPVSGVVLNDEGRAALVEHGAEDWHCALRNARRLYTAPPRRKPLSLTDLQEALVLTNLIDRDAIEDPEEYDEGSTMAQIDELHRIIKEGV